MGNFFKKALDKILSKDEANILMIGLDNAGKTTIMYKAKMGEYISKKPTIGFGVEMCTYETVLYTMIFKVWDVGGQLRIFIKACIIILN